MSERGMPLEEPVAGAELGRVGPAARQIGSVLLLAGAIGLLLFAYRHLGALAEGVERPLLATLIEELSGAFSCGVLFFAVRSVALRFRLDAPGWPLRIPVHLGALALFGLTLTSMMWGLRSLLFPLFGLGSFDYGRMPTRYFMEFPVQVIIYCLMTIGVYVAAHVRAARERALRAARLEARLSRAQLQNLELQLQPHFLFNTLNTISSTMYEDPAAADEMLSHLAELLRASLATQRGHEVALRQELATLEHYLSIVQARFGDRLHVRLAIDPAAHDLFVPSLLLQPLVENAVRHGRAARDGTARIEIAARKEAGRLLIEVSNDAEDSAAPAEKGSGLGLSLTRERLRLLYGDAHSFRAEARRGGFVVAMALPARGARSSAPAAGAA